MSPSSPRIRISFRHAADLILPYVRNRVVSQIKSIWLIILYLIFFQTVVLNIHIAHASVIGLGIGLVVAGLTFFMEGLFLGLMPLGDIIGSRLPKKSPVYVVLGFGIVLGFLATLAEPSIQVLQAAGKSVRPWEAPLLFLLLNAHAKSLVYAVGMGVGLAVCLGMIRFYYNLSLKPFIYVLIGLLLVMTFLASRDANMTAVVGLAWDCGAVTTGPVTVPLVLALGIGISRIMGSDESGATGFGVVTMASLMPVIAVLSLGLLLKSHVPAPMGDLAFFSPHNRQAALQVFQTEDRMNRYVLQEGSRAVQSIFFEGDAGKMQAFQETETSSPTGNVSADPDPKAQALIWKNLFLSVKAIALLVLPLFLVLLLFVREKPLYPDEIALGIAFAVIGLTLFSIGIEIGLDRLGTQVGANLPSSFKAIPLVNEKRNIDGFDPSLLQTAITPQGEKQTFFYARIDNQYLAIPYDPGRLDPQTGTYQYTPLRGPIFGSRGNPMGMIVVLIFGFIMGYGATLAEPALNALGVTVEELTAGTFKKPLLMQAVALGVGAGISLGVARIIWDLPMTWLLIPPYLLLLLVTRLSTEEFVSIGWDSAGVTTGPITVPLVLAMGLGIGSQVGVIEGFGILAAASVCPVFTVLAMGLYINRKRRLDLDRSAADLRESETGS